MSSSWDVASVFELFLLLVIGIGPKIALVPFLEVTSGMDPEAKARVTRKMIVTAGGVALILVALGEVLRKLLHFSIGSLSIAAGVMLFVIAATMVHGPSDPVTEHRELAEQDPLRLAVFPLAVPYLLNPAGFVALITASAEADTLSRFGIVIGLLALVLALDLAVFRGANRVSGRLDKGRMLVAEKVFGFLLAALAVQLVLNGLDDVGVVHLTAH